ncbi:hypothetical protein DIPPA_29155 [Diplonema papillatum]|nr:hypothetical protein DIPPA_29155 [Diplonema papillatum]
MESRRSSDLGFQLGWHGKQEPSECSPRSPESISVEQLSQLLPVDIDGAPGEPRTPAGYPYPAMPNSQRGSTTQSPPRPSGGGPGEWQPNRSPVSQRIPHRATPAATASPRRQLASQALKMYEECIEQEKAAQVLAPPYENPDILALTEGIEIQPCQLQLTGTWYGVIHTPEQPVEYVVSITDRVTDDDHSLDHTTPMANLDEEPADDVAKYAGSHSTPGSTVYISVTCNLKTGEVTIEDEDARLVGSLNATWGCIKGELQSKTRTSRSFPFRVHLKPKGEAAEEGWLFRTEAVEGTPPRKVYPTSPMSPLRTPPSTWRPGRTPNTAGSKTPERPPRYPSPHSMPNSSPSSRVAVRSKGHGKARSRSARTVRKKQSSPRHRMDRPRPSPGSSASFKSSTPRFDPTVTEPDTERASASR